MRPIQFGALQVHLRLLSSTGNFVCKHKCFLASMFYQNIGPFCVHVFHISWVYFSSKKPNIFCMLISWQNIFSSFLNICFFPSYSMFFFSRGACFSLSYHSSQRDHCFLHGCPTFALPSNPSLLCIYALPLTAPFFHSVLLVAYYFIYSVDWTGQRDVLVCSFFYDGQSMFPITYQPLLFLYHNTQSPFPCYLYQHEYLINHQFQYNVSRHYFLDIPCSLLVVHHSPCCPFLLRSPCFFLIISTPVLVFVN
jgi:hypothetical protein